jgi:DNA primase catalytic subunit
MLVAKDPEYFARREISYAIHLDGADSETIIRFLSFGDLDSFRQDIKTRVPIKIDYGAIYTYPPKNKVREISTLVSPITMQGSFPVLIC